MAITIQSSTVEQLRVVEDGVTKDVPRSFLNPIYSQLLGTNVQDVDRDGVNYKAFPYANRIGDYVVAIYSDGDAHASSDRQIMVRKNVNDINDQSIGWESVTFFENDTGAYDLSLVEDIMTDGQTFTFKVWVVSKSGGVVTPSVSNTYVESGNADPDLDGTYLMWSKVRQIGSNFYRVAYRPDAAGWNTALLESTDQTTWSLKGIIAKGHGAGLEYNEADIVETTSGNYLAVIREDSGAGRPLYTSTSSDLVTWTAPTLSTDFEGVQPHMIKLGSGTILLAVGDRTGASGFDSGGKPSSFVNATGVSVYNSTDNGSTWSFATILDRSWSTDCGQPFLEEVSSGVVSMLYYNSLQPTNSVTEPGISHKVFTEDNLV